MVLSKTSVAEDLTKVMNVAGVQDISFVKLVNSPDSKKTSSVPMKSVKNASNQTPDLSPVHQANCQQIFSSPEYRD